MITLGRAAEISVSKIETLRPEFQPRVRGWYQCMVESMVFAYIYEGFRSIDRQNELYCQGRTLPGKIVTNALGGQSYHNYGLAFDWVPLRRTDKATNMYEADWSNEELYQRGREEGLKFRLAALSWETPHLQDADYSHWRELAVKFPTIPVT